MWYFGSSIASQFNNFVRFVNWLWHLSSESRSIFRAPQTWFHLTLILICLYAWVAYEFDTLWRYTTNEWPHDVAHPVQHIKPNNNKLYWLERNKPEQIYRIVQCTVHSSMLCSWSIKLWISTSIQTFRSSQMLQCFNASIVYHYQF